MHFFCDLGLMEAFFTQTKIELQCMITMFNVVITMFNVVWLTPKLQPQAMPIKIHFQVYGLQPHLTKPHKPNSHTLTNLTNINNTSHKYKLIDKPHTQIQSQNLNNSLTLIKQTKSQHTYMDIIQPQKSTKLLFKETHSCSLKILLLSMWEDPWQKPPNYRKDAYL